MKHLVSVSSAWKWNISKPVNWHQLATVGPVLNANHNYATTPVAQQNSLVYLDEKMKKWKLLKKKLGGDKAGTPKILTTWKDSIITPQDKVKIIVIFG